jgi:Transposase zinc-binding domain
LTGSVHLIQCCGVHQLWTCALPVMTAACVDPLPLYRPRDPRASDLWRLLDQHFETFQQVYDERFAAKYGFWRPVVERSVTAFLKCGDLHQGFARVRCPDCQHEMFLAFSCKQRSTCPTRITGYPVTRSARC